MCVYKLIDIQKGAKGFTPKKSSKLKQEYIEASKTKKVTRIVPIKVLIKSYKKKVNQFNGETIKLFLLFFFYFSFFLRYHTFLLMFM